MRGRGKRIAACLQDKNDAVKSLGLVLKELLNENAVKNASNIARRIIFIEGNIVVASLVEIKLFLVIDKKQAEKGEKNAL